MKYKKSFIRSWFVLSIILYAIFLEGSRNYQFDALLGQYVFSLIYTFIPSLIVALFFINKNNLKKKDLTIKTLQKDLLEASTKDEVLDIADNVRKGEYENKD
ncbi:MAG: hypothetical protein QM490_05165 [Candidatus Gracilibacteria bacterium]